MQMFPMVPLVNGVTQTFTQLSDHLWEIPPSGLHPRNTTREQIFRENAVCQRVRDPLDHGLCPLICRAAESDCAKIFLEAMDTKRKLQRRCGLRILSSPSRPTSHSGHMGAYFNWRTAVLGCCVQRARLLSLTGTRTHTRLWTLKITIHSTKSTQRAHTPRPVCLGTLHQHTHSLLPMHSLRHTLHRGPPSPYCPSIWLVPFVPHILLAADGKLLQAGGVLRRLVLTCWRHIT